MQICLDYQPAIAQLAGVGRYTRYLAEHLVPTARAGGDAFRLFYFDFSRNAAGTVPPGAELQPCRWCPGRVVQWSWKTLGMPSFERFAGPADLYHFPNFILPPLGHGRSVVTIHDMSFYRHADFTERRNLAFLRRRIRATTERADCILTVSEFSRREIIECLGVPPERVRAIHLGIGPSFAPAHEEQVQALRKRFDLARPYLLSVGTLEPRKNYAYLIDVFENLQDFDGDLVIAGMRGWRFDPILQAMERSRLRNRIRYLEYVPENLLPALYTGAELFVYPSRYEGFGFPPLEAMACGTPVLSAATGSLPEVLGDAAVLVEGYAIDQWTAAIENLLRDRGARATRIDRGTAHAARFTWAETARRTWQVYGEVIGA